MTAAQLLTIWHAECALAPGYLATSPQGVAFNQKGLKFNELALQRIGAAIEALAEPALPAADTIVLDSKCAKSASGNLWIDLEPADSLRVPSFTEVNKIGAPRFQCVFCSQCGQAFGPGDSGFSHCNSHKQLRAISWQEERALERADSPRSAS